MKKTGAIALGCMALALAWASHSDNSSGRATTSQEVISSKPTQVSSLSGHRSGAFESRDETMPPTSNGPLSIPEEPEQCVPNETMTDQTEAFWAFDSGQVAEPDAQESDITLDQFDRPYTMTMTEAGFAQLSPEDKSIAITEIADSLHQARRDASDTYAQADADIARGDYDSAEAALVSEFQRLDDFNANSEGLYLTRIMGISYQQTALKQLETLYTRTDNHTKRQATQRQWQDLQAQKRQMQAAQEEQAG